MILARDKPAREQGSELFLALALTSTFSRENGARSKRKGCFVPGLF